MVLCLLRYLSLYDRSVKTGRWHASSTSPLHRLGNPTLGVVGSDASAAAPWRGGRAPGSAERRAATLSSRTTPGPREWSRRAWRSVRREYGRLAASAAHGRDKEFIGRELLGRMSDGSYLANTARGGLVVMEDLLRALVEGPLAGADLDVLAQEPPPPGTPSCTTRTSRSPPRQLLLARGGGGTPQGQAKCSLVGQGGTSALPRRRRRAGGLAKTPGSRETRRCSRLRHLASVEEIIELFV
jgi:hypothetical protein